MGSVVGNAGAEAAKAIEVGRYLGLPCLARNTGDPRRRSGDEPEGDGDHVGRHEVVWPQTLTDQMDA